MIKPGLQVQAFSPMKFDSEGNLIDEETRELLRKHLDAFATWILRLVGPGEIAQYACEMDLDPARV